MADEKGAAVWGQYKKTFAKMQIVIVVATFATYVYLGHEVARAASFLLMMEIAAVAGAAWGVRLKKKVDGPTK